MFSEIIIIFFFHIGYYVFKELDLVPVLVVVLDSPHEAGLCVECHYHVKVACMSLTFFLLSGN